MRKKHFILALQPHEAITQTHTAWSPVRNNHSLAFCASLLLLMGLAFPMTTPDVWKEQVRVGVLKIAYGWQNTPLLASSSASAIYTDIFGKVPKTGCSDAQERDWKVVCPLISSQMSNGIDCDHASAQGKADILKNFEQSKTTAQYACLYGN